MELELELGRGGVELAGTRSPMKGVVDDVLRKMITNGEAGAATRTASGGRPPLCGAAARHARS